MIEPPAITPQITNNSHYEIAVACHVGTRTSVAEKTVLDRAQRAHKPQHTLARTTTCKRVEVEQRTTCPIILIAR